MKVKRLRPVVRDILLMNKAAVFSAADHRFKDGRGMANGSLALRESPGMCVRAVIGIGCLWAWLWFLLQNSILASAPYEADQAPYTVIWVLPVVMYAAGFLLIGALGAKMQALDARRARLVNGVAAPFVMTLGVLLTMMGPDFTPYGWQVLYALGSALSGFFGANAFVGWMRVLGKAGARDAVLVFPLAILFAAAVSCVVYVANISLSSFLGAGAIATSGLLYFTVVLGLMSFATMRLLVSFDQAHSGASAPAASERGRIPWRVVLTTAVIGASSGAMDSAAYYVSSSLGFVLVAVSLAVGALLFLLVVRFCRPSYNTLFYHISLPAMAFAWMLLACGGGFLSVGVGLSSISYGFAETAAIVLIATLIKRDELAPHLACVFVVGSIEVGRMVGTMAFLTPFVSVLTVPQGGVAAAVIAFALMGAALYLSVDVKDKQSWAFVRPSEPAESLDPIDLAVSLIGSDNGLTSREMDVLRLLARGRNRSFIADKLVLSPETVKVHIRHVYSKLGVHSQQELMTRVEDRAKKGSEFVVL